jgi:TolB protein
MSQLTETAGDNERPSWAPDMRHLAFASNRSGSWQVYSMLANGSKVRALTRGGKNEGPAWSGHPESQ